MRHRWRHALRLASRQRSCRLISFRVRFAPAATAQRCTAVPSSLPRTRRPDVAPVPSCLRASRCTVRQGCRGWRLPRLCWSSYDLTTHTCFLSSCVCFLTAPAYSEVLLFFKFSDGTRMPVRSSRTGNSFSIVASCHCTTRLQEATAPQASGSSAGGGYHRNATCCDCRSESLFRVGRNSRLRMANPAAPCNPENGGRSV
eukprot:SAG31_NODE_139_length_22847_cov_8.142474_6_plen_200_part_00